MKKFLVALLLLCLLQGCSATDYQKQIYDNNQDIVKQGDSFYYLNHVIIESQKHAEISFGRFFGCDTIFTINNSEAILLSTSVDSNIEEGRFKVVLINPDNSITQLDSEQTFSINEGKYRIKIVGNDAKGAVEIGYSLADIN